MSKKEIRARVLQKHRLQCFGRGDEILRRTGPCPPSCWKHCESHNFNDNMAPRVVGRRKKRPYTQIPNTLLARWPKKFKATPMVRLTYLYLISRTRPEDRIIAASGRQMADEMGISYRAFREYVRALKRSKLVSFIPMRDMHHYGDSNRAAIVMLDLPRALIEVREY